MIARGVSVFVALLAYYFWHFNLAIKTQLLSKDLPHLFSASGKCKVIRDKKANGQFGFCEDGLVVAPGVAIFSCDPSRHTWNTVMGPMLDPNPRGALWALRYTSDSAEDDEPYQLELNGFPVGADFHPLGIDATPDASRLLVSNHGRHSPTIEVFRLEIAPGTVTLTHETTLSHPSFVSPNAIAAVSSNTFYLSQDHYFTRRMPWPFRAFLPFLETMTMAPLGWVDLIRFETSPSAEIEISTVASMIPFSNGASISPDGSTLAVASTNRVEVLLYKRNDTSLDLISSVRVPFSPDNIAFAGDRLLVGGHPHLPSFMKFASRKSDRSPSHVVQIEPKSNSAEPWITRAEAGVEVRDVFKSDGSFFSTSSGAFMDLDAKSMFVVGLYAPGVVKCEHAWYIWRLDHAIRAQLLPKDLPRLFNPGGECKVIRDKDVNPQFRFCEDGLVFAPGVALFSCDPGRNTSTSTVDTLLGPETRGGLWAMHYTLTSFETPYPLELVGYPTDAEFHPLGIDITPRDKSGASRLLVTNRGLGQPTVEVFDIQLASGVVAIVHKTTLRHPAFTAPNSIFAISPSAFYVSQDHYFTGRMAWPLNLVLPWLETMLALPFGRVHLVQFEASQGLHKVTTAASMIPCANGVAVSPDGSTLVVASTNRAEVLFYERTETAIKLVSSARVPFSADNIAFVGERLLVAGHPYLPAYVALVKQQSDHAPSHVVSIAPRGTEGSWLARAAAGVDVVDVFKSDGTFFSTSSGAFVDLETKSMFVVGLYAPGIAKCSFV